MSPWQASILLLFREIKLGVTVFQFCTYKKIHLARAQMTASAGRVNEGNRLAMAVLHRPRETLVMDDLFKVDVDIDENADGPQPVMVSLL